MSIETDANTIAKALMETWAEWYEDGNTLNYGWECRLCNSNRQLEIEDVVHAICCPVMVAKDILVRV